MQRNAHPGAHQPRPARLRALSPPANRRYDLLHDPFRTSIYRLLSVLCAAIRRFQVSPPPSLTSPIYYEYPHSEGPRDACETLAGFTVYFYFLSRMYSACISHELQLIIQNPTYRASKWHLIYHLVSHGVSLLSLIAFILSDNIGMSSTLMCWNKHTPHTLLNK